MRTDFERESAGGNPPLRAPRERIEAATLREFRRRKRPDFLTVAEAMPSSAWARR